jgi:hypothetical protein
MDTSNRPEMLAGMPDVAGGFNARIFGCNCRGVGRRGVEPNPSLLKVEHFQSNEPVI